MLRLIPTFVLCTLILPAPVLRAQQPAQQPVPGLVPGPGPDQGPGQGNGEGRGEAPGAAAGGPAESAAEVRLSLDEAVALVRERTGGRVVRADPRPEGTALVYEIRVLTTDGRVRTYRVDAASGTMR